MWIWYPQTSENIFATLRHSSSGENQPIDENENAVRMQTELGLYGRTGLYLLTVSSFISFSLYFDYILLNLLISSSVANNSFCVRLNIVWNWWKGTLKASTKEQKCKCCLCLFISGHIRISRVCFWLIVQAIANVGKYLQIFVLPAV